MDTWLKANNGKERAALKERGDREGLCVRITPKGKITFQIRYCYQGKPRQLNLGSYPLMSLKQARGEAQRLRAQHEQGHDPQIVRLLEKQTILKADSRDTVPAVVRGQLPEEQKGPPRHPSQLPNSFLSGDRQVARRKGEPS
ncbi:MAG: Arm DNA-binding domain-containing protein [Burkholderiales bacterium]